MTIVAHETDLRAKMMPHQHIIMFQMRMNKTGLCFDDFSKRIIIAEREVILINWLFPSLWQKRTKLFSAIPVCSIAIS